MLSREIQTTKHKDPPELAVTVSWIWMGLIGLFGVVMIIGPVPWHSIPILTASVVPITICYIPTGVRWLLSTLRACREYLTVTSRLRLYRLIKVVTDVRLSGLLNSKQKFIEDFCDKLLNGELKATASANNDEVFIAPPKSEKSSVLKRGYIVSPQNQIVVLTTEENMQIWQAVEDAKMRTFWNE